MFLTQHQINQLQITARSSVEATLIVKDSIVSTIRKAVEIATGDRAKAGYRLAWFIVSELAIIGWMLLKLGTTALREYGVPALAALKQRFQRQQPAAVAVPTPVAPEPVEAEPEVAAVETAATVEPDPWEAPVAEFCTIPALVATVIQFPLALPPAGKRRRRAAGASKTADKAQTKPKTQTTKAKSSKSTGTRKSKKAAIA